MTKAEEILKIEDRKRIVRAIKQAEQETSGEIRFFIEDKCKGEVLDRASHIFAKLDMHKTDLRNGVLFYLSVLDRKFAVLGDSGINAKVPKDFWESVKIKVISKLVLGDIAEGVSQGIVEAGEKLQQFFPYQSNDVNELSDDIVFGDKKEDSHE